ncbi:MAG: hypothetical protein AAGU14_10425 [Eubacteriaceae bacterium]
MNRICVLIITVLLIVLFCGCANQVFDGSSTGNDEQFILSYSVLNCEKTHQMTLDEGSVISVSINNGKGRIDVMVVGSQGRVLYKGDDADNNEFKLTVQQSDTYTFSVTGKNAKNGNISFIVNK